MVYLPNMTKSISFVSTLFLQLNFFRYENTSSRGRGKTRQFYEGDS